MKNKTLWIVFIALLGIFLLSQLFKGDKKIRSFDPNLFPIDTAAVTGVEIYSKADSFELVKLEKKADGWIATKGSKSTPAEADRVSALLEQLLQSKAQRIAAKKKEKWTDYEIDDAAAKAHVKVLEGSKTVADFWVGGFRFNQQTRSGTSFVRQSNADDVYAVDGFISMSLSQGFDSYRDKTLVKLTPADLTSISLNQDGQTTTYNQSGGQWSTDNGVVLDSLKMATYLNALTNFNGSTFVDDFNEQQSSILSRQSITFSGNNMIEPVTVNCFEVAGRAAPFVCQSTLNPDAYFSGDSTNVYSKIFKTPQELQ